MKKNNKLEGCGVTLSTGAFVNMNAYTVQETIDVVSNLFDCICLEHIEEILNQTGERGTVEIIRAEAKYLVENQMHEDPEGPLCWFLTALALQRLAHILAKIRKGDISTWPGNFRMGGD